MVKNSPRKVRKGDKRENLVFEQQEQMKNGRAGYET
jgi:hypothetical protein